MKPAPFTYLRPDSLAEALQVLADGSSETRLLAGGQSLIAMLNMRLARPAQLLDISNLEPLRQIAPVAGNLRVGACVTQAELKAWPQLDQRVPILSRALEHVGHPQTRNRGTVGGSIAHADPSAELPLCLALLGGTVHLQSHSGQRTLDAAAFQTGMLQTALAADEILTAVDWPLSGSESAYAFDEFSLRRGDFAIIAVGVHRTPSQIRIAIGGLRDAPHVQSYPVAMNASQRRDALDALARRLPLQSDSHASAGLRRKLIMTLGLRLWQRVLG